MSVLTLRTVVLLTVPPLLWAGNAVVGRLMSGLVPPMTLNLARWVLAALMLLPLAAWVLRPGANGLWPHWRRFTVLGLLGVGSYNALQYLALKTSSPLNVTLVASSMPLWMLAFGGLWFGAPVRRAQVLGAVLSMAGVLVVLARGQPGQLLGLRLVMGDLYMLAASAAWALYSWLLARPAEPAAIRQDWAAFLLAQTVPGMAWAGLFAGVEWAVTDAHVVCNAQTLAALVFIAAGPAVLAYRCWGLGVQRAGPALAGFFSNLTPLFAALLSAAFLREPPQPYHALAFALIVAAIVVSSRP